MCRRFVKDLGKAEKVKIPLIIKEKHLLPFREKPGYYLSLNLGDKSGEIISKVWENGESVYERFETGEVVLVEGVTSEYQGTLQLKVFKIERLEDYNLEEFLPSSPRDRQEMLDELLSWTDSLSNPHLRRIVEAFVKDEKFLKIFSGHPAAKRIHHSYVGGLLEHTLQVTKIVESLAEIYPRLNRDLLVAGALLHDIGKVEELKYSHLIEYTDRGRMLGHIVLGVEMVKEKISRLEGFPPELEMKLIHLIVSHHGEYEWQSPKRPKTAEALALHHADFLDAHIHQFQCVRGEGPVWNRNMQRFIYGIEERDCEGGEAAAGREKSAPEHR